MKAPPSIPASFPLFSPKNRVTFLGHTACPAVVIVQDARQEWFRCSREDLSSFHQGQR